MAKKHAMTAKRRAALKKAQLASARKRSSRAKTTSAPARRKGMSGRKKALIYGASLGAYMVGTNQKINYAISKNGYYTGSSGTRYNRQSGPHWMQFYGKGMSPEKQHRGFNRHFKAHATQDQKMARHLHEMRYGQNNVTVTRVRPMPSQLALPRGVSSRRKRFKVF